MTIKPWTVKVLSLFSIVGPVMAQEALLHTPESPVVALGSSTSTTSSHLADDYKRAHVGTLYRWSVVTLLAANASDAASSWQKREANPLVAGSATQFGMTAIAIKSGFVGASLLVQHFVLRNRPDLAKRMAWMNFVSSGALAGVSVHNSRLR